MTEYKALTYINLPLLDIKKAPGDIITDEEFTQGGQEPTQIQELIQGGSISTDLNAPILPEHEPVEIPPNPNADVDLTTSDEGKGVVE